jgi:hypothetical protein
VFPSEKLSTPMSKDNCWNRSIKPKLATAGLAWANFQVMRRTHSTLMGDLGIDGKLVADQCGHTLDVNQNVIGRLRSLADCLRCICWRKSCSSCKWSTNRARCQAGFSNSMILLERETGIEPATFSLGS